MTTGKLPIGLFVVAGLAVAAVSAGVAFLGVAGSLPADIAITLTPVAPAHLTGGLDLVIVHGSPTGALRVVQVMTLGLLLGGVPSAFAAMLLATRTTRARARWTPAWSGVFLAGFVFQLSSLVITATTLIWLVGVLVDYGVWSIETTLAPLLLACSAASSACALRSWLTLRASAFEERSRLPGGDGPASSAIEPTIK